MQDVPLIPKSKPGAVALVLAAAMVLAAAVAGCKGPEVIGKPGSGPGSAPAPGGGGSGGSSGGGPSPGGSFALPDGGADVAPASPGNNPIGEQCAETGAQAEQVPVDLLLLVDSSGSMAQQSGNSTKWALATEALRGFVKDPRSTGLGLGLGFFPKLAPEKTCTANAQCPGNTFFGDTCVQKHLCGKAGAPIGLSGPECDDPLDECDDPGQTCLPIGTCSMGGGPCLGVGMPCAGGAAGDTCNARPRSCQVNSADWCPQDYNQAAVAIAALPANEPALTRALTNQRPVGGTPLGPAMRGGIAQLRAHVMANPGRRVALVLVSDGLPDGFCSRNFADFIGEEVAAARMAMPSIPSYVIGVFSPAEIPRAQPVLNMLATAGGTGQPFILMTSSDLGQRFQEALNQIRGTALACEFTIPASMGAIDYARVNVRWKGATSQEDLLYVGSAARCDPTRGGWYFDVDPATGGTPKRVLICEASCQKFKTDAAAKVELRFGCKTRAID
jgi:hypothetical protein